MLKQLLLNRAIRKDIKTQKLEAKRSVIMLVRAATDNPTSNLYNVAASIVDSWNKIK